MKRAIALLIALSIAAAAQAKLPPPSPEAKAAADATKDKAAWGEKVAAYKLCQVQDKVAAQYFKTHADAKKSAAEVPPCSDPGPYVAAGATNQVGVADAKPVPAAGKAEPAAAGAQK